MPPAPVEKEFALGSVCANEEEANESRANADRRARFLEALKAAQGAAKPKFASGALEKPRFQRSSEHNEAYALSGIAHIVQPLYLRAMVDIMVAHIVQPPSLSTYSLTFLVSSVRMSSTHMN